MCILKTEFSLRNVTCLEITERIKHDIELGNLILIISINEYLKKY